MPFGVPQKFLGGGGICRSFRERHAGTPFASERAVLQRVSERQAGPARAHNASPGTRSLRIAHHSHAQPPPCCAGANNRLGAADVKTQPWRRGWASEAVAWLVLPAAGSWRATSLLFCTLLGVVQRGLAGSSVRLARAAPSVRAPPRREYSVLPAPASARMRAPGRLAAAVPARALCCGEQGAEPWSQGDGHGSRLVSPPPHAPPGRARRGRRQEQAQEEALPAAGCRTPSAAQPSLPPPTAVAPAALPAARARAAAVAAPGVEEGQEGAPAAEGWRQDKEALAPAA